MTRVAVLLSVFLFLAPFAAGAQNLGVSYLEGEVQVRSGSSWSVLGIGDSVPLTASVRLSAQAYLQLKGMGMDIALTRPGTYVVQNIVAARKTTSAGSSGSAVAGALRYLVFGPATQQGTTSGARAAEKGKTEEEAWVESSAEVFLEAGKGLIKSGQYDKAIEQLRQALESAAETEAPEIQFYLGYASSMTGDVHQAWKTVADLRPSGSEAWASDFILLKAKLLEDASAYEEAIALLKRYEQGLSRDAQRAQFYYFLLGLGYRGAGDSENAKKALSRTVEISKESDIGKSAREILSGP